MMRPRGLSREIAGELGRKIVSGALPEGNTFRLQDEEAQYSVSVTVAREVMHALQNKGLVEARPRRGITVLARDSWDLLDLDVLEWHHNHLGAIIADLEESRLLIEPWAAKTAAAVGTPGHVRRLRAAMDELTAITESGDVSAMTVADMNFHRALLEASGNSIVARIARVLEPALRRRDELTMHDRKREDLKFLPLHEEIVVCIEAKDPVAAEEAAIRLITESGSDSAQALNQAGG
jgi:DNA-binding FadR family transcriptional regulator